MDLSYVHAVGPGDTFVMEPGWRNFMRVRRDQSLALQNAEVVQAPLDGYMLMPLYQGLGAEGYYLCRPVSPAWLTLSRWARRCRLELALPLAPGVRSLDRRSGTCRTRRRLSRPVVGALHLCGYRKRVLTGDDGALWHRKPQ
jgi:succinylglutamate desuccinylase